MYRRVMCYIVFVVLCVSPCALNMCSDTPKSRTQKITNEDLITTAQNGTFPPRLNVSEFRHLITQLNPDKMPAILMVRKKQFIEWCNAVIHYITTRALTKADIFALCDKLAKTMEHTFKGKKIFQEEWNYTIQQHTNLPSLLQQQAQKYLDNYDIKSLVLILSNLHKLNSTFDNDFVTKWQKAYLNQLKNESNIQPINLARGLSLAVQTEAPRIDGLLTTWYRVTRDRLDNFKHGELATSIYAIANVEDPPSEDWIRAWLSRTYNLINTFSIKNLVQIAYSLKGVSIPSHTAEFKQFAEAWLATTYTGMESITTQEGLLYKSIYAIARLNIQPSQSWLDAWMKQLTAYQNKLSDAAFSHVVYGLGIIRAPEYKDVMPSIRSLITSRGVSHLKQQDAELALYGLALMHVIQSDDTIATSAREIVNNLPEVTSMDLNDQALQQLYWSLYYFGYDDTCQTIREHFGKPEQTKYDSKDETYIYNVLRKLAHANKIPKHPEREYYISSVYVSVDFAFPSYNFILEYDGPHHFFVTTHNRIPKDDLRDTLLRKAGWSIARLPYQEWLQARENNTKTNTLLNILSPLRVTS